MSLIETRRDLASHLQSQMVASRGSWSPSDDEDIGRTSVKTYLVEAHAGDGEDAVPEALGKLGARLGFQLQPGRDADLFALSMNGIELWLDTSIRRFWRLHTTAKVEAADAAHEAIVSAVPWLDRVWLGPDYLENLADRVGGEVLVFSMSHDRTRLTPGDRPVTVSDYVTLRLWASHAQETLRKLRSADVFPHAVSVRSVRLRSGSDERDGEFCVAEYFRHGKITASGTSFDEHNRVVVRMLADYAKLVEGIEETYGLGAVIDGDGCPRVTGRPIVLDVDWMGMDLEFAVSRIFSSADPFRLWGLPERVGEDHYRARAVDLHVGGVITIDVTPKRVVMLLPRGVCGNTVARFLSNLRCHVNADAILASA